MSHTPGPWTIKTIDSGVGDEQECLILGPMRRIGVFDKMDLIADAYPDSMHDLAIPEDYMANARLIAAAPEMLQIIHALLDPYDKHREHRARVLLAKIEGQ